MPKHYDSIIIGGGHNGLVAAAYLAKAGKNVLVLERRDMLGGVAVTEEFVPGYKFSSLADNAAPLAPEILRDLNRREGLTIVMVTHNLEISHATDRVVKLVEGRVEAAISDPFADKSPALMPAASVA